MQKSLCRMRKFTRCLQNDKISGRWKCGIYDYQISAWSRLRHKICEWIISITQWYFYNEKTYQEERIIITNDKDFGYLIFRTGFPPPAIILLRFRDESPTLKINAIKTILKLPEEKVLNHFIVASENKIRIRPLEKWEKCIYTTMQLCITAKK